jgi:hypothetical protein
MVFLRTQNFSAALRMDTVLLTNSRPARLRAVVHMLQFSVYGTHPRGVGLRSCLTGLASIRYSHGVAIVRLLHPTPQCCYYYSVPPLAGWDRSGGRRALSRLLEVVRRNGGGGDGSLSSRQRQ